MGIGLIALLVAVPVFAGSRASIATQRLAGLENARCPFDVPHGVSEGRDLSCGFVAVPERHDAPAGPSIRLAVAIFSSSAQQPEQDPLVLIRGGPGESTLDVFAPVVASSVGKQLLTTRDIVLIELRGTYYSDPALTCPEWDTYIDEHLGTDIRIEEDLALDMQAIAECHERLLAEGVDLSAFNNIESAADIPAVLSALGYNKFNLFATSAGTLIAQHLMRDHADSLRSVILDSPLPLAERPYAEFVLGADQSLNKRSAACDSTSRCHDAFPDIPGALAKAIANLNREPTTVTLENPNNDQKALVLLNGDRVAELVYGLFSDSETASALPLLIDALAEGDTSFLPTFGGVLFHPEKFSRGLQYSALCAEEIDFGDDDIVLPGRNPDFERVVAGVWPRKLLAGCEIWEVDRLPAVANQPVTSNIPTLIVAGQFDILPDKYGHAVLESLVNGQFVAVPGAAHTPTGSSDCSLDIAERFLDAPSAPVDTSCLDEIKVRFVTEPFARRLLLPEPPLWRLVTLVVALLGLLSWPAVRLWQFARRAPDRATSIKTPRASLALGAAVGLNLVLVVVFFASNPLEVIYGFSPVLRAATWLPLLSIPATAAASFIAVMAWRRHYWSLPRTIHYTLVVFAAVIFVWQLNWWHLLAS